MTVGLNGLTQGFVTAYIKSSIQQHVLIVLFYTLLILFQTGQNSVTEKIIVEL